MKEPQNDLSPLEFIQEQVFHFAEEFFGYGDPTSKIWMIGLEEHGCGTIDNPNLDEAFRRLKAWKKFAGEQLVKRPVDLEEFLKESCLPSKSNPTWNALARSVCAMTGANYQEGSRAAFPKVLAKRLFLAELQPLPCKGTNPKAWPWKNWIRDERLVSRESWLQCPLIEKRVKDLGESLAKNNPDVVICYGGAGERDVLWRSLWDKVAKAAGREICRPGRQVLKGIWPARDSRKIILVPHPGGGRLVSPDDYFDELGVHLARVPHET